MVPELVLLALALLCALLYLRRQSLSLRIASLPNSFVPCTRELKPFTSVYTLIETEPELQVVVSELQNSDCLGVDIEQFQPKGTRAFVCLVQISDGVKTYLLDAVKLKGAMKALRKLLESQKILKVMHGCHNDIRWLQRDFRVHVVNLYDTQVAARLIGLEALSLNFLWGKYCEHTMSKEEKKSMQLADWSARPLSAEMASYAALDAYFLPYLQSITCKLLSPEQLRDLRRECNALSLQRFDSLQVQKKDKTTDKLFRELCSLREREATGPALEEVAPTVLLEEIAQKKPVEETEIEKMLANWPLSSCVSEIASLCMKAVNKASQIDKKQERFERFREKYTVHRDVYENCQMQAPDGEILCYCDKKKTQWYLDRNLADVISEDPMVFRLRFEPNGRGFSDVYADPDFYMKFKENQCVICGAKKNFLRYHVVPVLYRQHFPEKLKSHRSHDVVLLCPKCHEIANKHSDLLKKQFAKDYGVPLNEFGDLHKQREDVVRIGKLCRSLLKHRKNMPDDRRERMDRQLSEFFEENPQYREFLEKEKGLKSDEISEELLKFMAKNGTEMLSVYGSVNWKKEAVNKHGLEVLRRIPDLKDFIKKWRIHFIETMNPQFLPDAWSVDHALNLRISS